MKTLHISAGGNGTRIASYISSVPLDVPKHLLPIPCAGGTLLGEIVRGAGPVFDQVQVWANQETCVQLAQALNPYFHTNVHIDTDMTGPMGPVVRHLLQTERRTYGCAGDFYSDFDWDAFERFHDVHGRPISILVAKSVPAPGGARFLLEAGCVASWERVDRTTEEDRINIGCYIVDPVPEVVEALRALKRHKEDPFFDAFVPRGLVTGYDPGTIGYNVNVSAVYEELVRALV